MKRDKSVTRRKIMDAIEQILMREQGSQIRINSIAKEAGVDKVMIYRYFGNLEKLLIAFAEEKDIWPPLELLLRKKSDSATESPLQNQLICYLTNYLSEIRRDQMAKEILRWALTNMNALTKSMENDREKQIKSLMNQLFFDQNANPEIDLGAVISLLHAGITHLVLCAKHSDYYMGLDLKSARGWKKVENALGEILESYAQYHLVLKPKQK
jgi:AcrR family transcriptional regulator